MQPELTSVVVPMIDASSSKLQALSLEVSEFTITNQ